MPRSQLERDMLRNAHDRLETWRMDTLWRCEAANMPPGLIASMIYTCYVGELISMTHFLKMSEQDFLILMGQAYRKFKRMTDEEKKKSTSWESP